MTIFIAALFLPYTVNFETVGGSDGKQDTAKTTESLKHAEKGEKQTQHDGSLLEQAADEATLPQTIVSSPIGDTPDIGTLFIAEPNREPPLMRLPSATRLASLARTDTHSPGWGRADTGPHFAQPTSRAQPPPPASILRHQGLPIQIPPEEQGPPHSRHRTFSKDNQINYEDYSIEPSNMSNGGLVTAIDAACEQGLLENKVWVGTLGMPVNALNDKVKTSIADRMKLDFESIVVLVDDDDMTGIYEQYCKAILWPLLHYQMPDTQKSKTYQDHSWNFYVKVNQAFANTIVKNWEKDDKVWIQDYHLMLVPSLVRKQLPEAEIGFFLHTAFPSFEVFRCLPRRKEILEGLLGANLIGFHAAEYVRHFMQTCVNLLNAESTCHGIVMVDGRFIHVSFFPLGVNPSTVYARRQSKDVKAFIRSFAKKYKKEKLFIARDKMDNIRGVYQKLLAYDYLLEHYPEYRQNVVLIQIATTTTEDASVLTRATDLASRINSTYSTIEHNPLIFLNQDLDYAKWLALLNIADCLLITSLREGMNLTGHEFILCQDGKGGKIKHSPLILSEFIGAATVFPKDTAVHTNPWGHGAVAKSMVEALRMSPEEKETRWNALNEIVLSHASPRWCSKYLEALSHAYKEHSKRNGTSVPSLSVTSLKKMYDASSKRLLILDYEGTLASWEPPLETVFPAPWRLEEVLSDLIEDKKNTVYIMSAKPTNALETVFSRIHGVGLIAENGAFLRKPKDTQWIEICDVDYATSWKEGVFDILNYYENRVRGSRVKELQSCLIFDYWNAENADSAFASSANIADHVNELCATQGVCAIPVERAILISDKHINKATAAEKIVTETFTPSAEGNIALPDFLFVVGDSREDEYIFDWTHKMEKNGVKNCISAAVGQRNTAASCNIEHGSFGVTSVLQKLTSTVII